MEIVGIGDPQDVSDQPTLQPVDLIFVDEAWGQGGNDTGGQVVIGSFENDCQACVLNK